MEKDVFIKSVLNSTTGIIKVMPNNLLFDKIQARIEEEKPVANYTKWLLAATIVILLSLNIGILSDFSKNSNKSNEVSQLVSITDNQLY